ncbi:MAG TPA: S8 family serine peptidase [Thermoanaerobaculia bacterium]|nr:S8 family serine peptidase [Thermoanaerobaculia bacterium]
MTGATGLRALLLAPLLAGASLPAATAVPGKVSLAAVDPRARAAAPREGRFLRLSAAVFDPLTEAPDFAASGLREKPDAPDYGVVQFLPGRLDEKERLENLGVRFFGYLPENAFQVRLTPRAETLLRESQAVRWTGTWNPGYKVSPRLRPGSPQTSPGITVQLFPDASLDGVSRTILARVPGVTQTMAREDPVAPRLRYDVPASVARDFVREVSAIPGVAWLEPWEPARLFNNGSLGPVQSNQESSISGGACTTCTLFSHGLTGTGQIVAVADSGCDTRTCFFRKSASASDVTDAENTVPPATGTLFPEKKVMAYWVHPGATAYDNNLLCGDDAATYHGTHTSGTAVGDNYLTPSTPEFPGIDPGDGMAPNAQLLFQDIGNDATGCLVDPDLYALYLQALSGRARIHSNSWGNATQGDYTSEDQDVDRFLFDHEEMAIFYSAGNSGPAPTSTGSPGNAKNVVSVGATGHGISTFLAGFSGRGPTADGRIKPDVVAEGEQVSSASGDTGHTSEICLTNKLSGTSMACPTAAGASALLRQYFADGFYPTGRRSPADRLEPPAPLVKAVLLNGTLPLGDSPGFGNFGYGWGRVFLDSNLFFDGDARKLRVWSLANPDGMKTGESHSTTVTVGAGQELRVTLVWSDAEGTLGAAQALVNDLDLTVTDGANTWRGNVLASSGDSAGGGEADRVNSVEQVRISAPAAGTYTLTVTASSVPGNGRSDTDRQGYALVASMASCASKVTAAPTALSAASDPVMGVDLSFTKAPGSTVTQVYRSSGDCRTDIGTFQYVGQAPGSSFTDARAQGGTTYSYVLRGADGCGEGPPGGCVTVTAGGRCDRKPVFAGVTSATPVGTDCRIRLGWEPASAGCVEGTNLHYNVYRSEALSPGVPGTRVVSVPGLQFEDSGVSEGTSYLYVVRAEDSNRGGNGPNGGNEETNSVAFMSAASGPSGDLGTWSDDGGDGGGKMSGEPPWRITATQAVSGSHAYHAAPDSGFYPARTCASLTTPPLTLGAGSVLSYSTRYNLESQFDGVIVEMSADGGASWSDLPPTSPAGYPDTLAKTKAPPQNACRYPGTQGAFTGPKQNTGLTDWTRYQTSLSPSHDGKTVRIRWRLTTDSNTEYEGFFLDAISVTNVHVLLACTPTAGQSAPYPRTIPSPLPPPER